MVTNVTSENSLFYRSLDSSTFLFGVETCGFCLKKHHGTVLGVLEEEAKKVCLRSHPYRILHQHLQFECFLTARKGTVYCRNLIHVKQQIQKAILNTYNVGEYIWTAEKNTKTWMTIVAMNAISSFEKKAWVAILLAASCHCD